jgi:AraC-like DNA-binding protein
MLTSDLKLALVLRGVNRFRYRRSSWLVPRSTLILAEPGQLHTVESVAGAFDVRVLSLDVETLLELKRDETRPLRDGLTLNGPLTTDRRCVRAFRELYASIADSTSSGLALEERLVSLVGGISRAYGGCEPATVPSCDAPAVRRARELLHDRYLESLTLDELAAESGLAKFRFLRAFKREVGLPPHAFQVHLRVDHARRMLASGAPVADAAAAAGFFDQSHFHRHFLRLQQLTPAEYRRA